MICKCLELRLILNFIFIAQAMGIKFYEKMIFNLPDSVGRQVTCIGINNMFLKHFNILDTMQMNFIIHLIR